MRQNNNKKPRKGRNTGPRYEGPAEIPEELVCRADPWPMNRVLGVLNSTIVLDDICKGIVFTGYLLTYTEEEQINLVLIGESSCGKTIIALETALYFPDEDKIEIAEGTPRAFWYEMSSIRGEDGVELPHINIYIKKEIEKWAEENPEPERGSKTLWRDLRQTQMKAIKAEYWKLNPHRFLDLHQKIIILLDQKDDRLLRNLRPLLSHDKKQITSKLVSKTGASGSWRTENTTIQGYPTFVVCSTGYLKDKQEQTRFIMLSPETSQVKIMAVLEYQAKMFGNRQAHRERIKKHPQRRALMERITVIRDQRIANINLDDELMQLVLDRYRNRALQPRHQRHFRYLVSLIKGHALLNFDNRRREGGVIWANLDDVKAGIQLYEPVELSNELGLPPEALRFYLTIVKEQCEKPTRYIVLKQRYRDVNGRPIDHYRFLEILNSLAAAGLIEMNIPDPIDRRYRCIREL